MAKAVGSSGVRGRPSLVPGSSAAPVPASPGAIGPVVRGLRRREGLTLEQLAQRSHVSRAMLSSVERGDKNPTLPVLAKIAAALGVGISELMGETTAGLAAHVVKARARLVYRDETSGIERHLLSPTHLDTGMEVVEHVLPAGQTFAGYLYAGLRTSKCAVVSSGQLTLELGNVVYTLDPGDSITFEVTGDYAFANRRQEVCRYHIYILHRRT